MPVSFPHIKVFLRFSEESNLGMQQQPDTLDEKSGLHRPIHALCIHQLCDLR